MGVGLLHNVSMVTPWVFAALLLFFVLRALLRKRRQDGEIRDIAPAEEKRPLDAEETLRFGFERLVLRRIAAQQARPCRANRSAGFERCDDGFGQARGGCQSQIIIGSEIETRTR